MKGFGRAFADELRAVRGDRGALLVLVGAVLIYALFYPLPYLPEVLKEVPAVVVDADHSALSRQLVRMLDTHELIAVRHEVPTLAQAEAVVASSKAQFHGRERDVREVRNYWNALLRAEEWAATKAPLTEEMIRRMHALVETGPRARPTPYRDGQNVIRESGSNAIVYLPPEATDVPGLMAALVGWFKSAEKEQLPAPVAAGLMHYQFVTIHPYYDGNGRTARLLATLILSRAGYGLNGFLSLEEHHARDLEAYYHSLAVHPHHNYYEGRAEADLTPWLEYFVLTVATVFSTVREEVIGNLSATMPHEAS